MILVSCSESNRLKINSLFYQHFGLINFEMSKCCITQRQFSHLLRGSNATTTTQVWNQGQMRKCIKQLLQFVAQKKKSLKLIQINMGVRGNRGPHISHFWWKQTQTTFLMCFQVSILIGPMISSEANETLNLIFSSQDMATLKFLSLIN